MAKKWWAEQWDTTFNLLSFPKSNFCHFKLIGLTTGTGESNSGLYEFLYQKILLLDFLVHLVILSKCKGGLIAIAIERVSPSS